MNNKVKNGFTLTELLGVMVVLAIIAIIAIPIVSNVIEKTEISSNKRSVEMYASAVQNAITKYKLDGNKGFPDFVDLEIDYDGDVRCDVNRIYLDKTLYLSDCYVNGEYIKDYSHGEQKHEVVYFDVLKGEKCDGEEYRQSYNGTDYLNSTNGYNGVQMTDKLQNSCLKFYVLNYNSDTLDLILDHNIVTNLAWNSTGSNVGGPSKENNNVLYKLKDLTSYWQGVEIPENYTLYEATDESQERYTIDYTGYKARLITAQEVANITNNKNWDERTSTTYFYFDTGTEYQHPACKSGDVSQCKYGWLYDRTSSGCKTNTGCLNNSSINRSQYWTATAVASDSTKVWIVGDTGGLIQGLTTITNTHSGVRPVIKVKISKFF